ncbi:hypothetical protein OJ996_05065 [Luteolibacter sp. GHJ8]|uniref:Uncharacterized protein n=1 Tax=Luteolibacter rhizosphaerae TaxID=2989719 RepID=A0ABT3G093_9BACT|nr:hypothetical protein [Luteolibacter rhizosphaerae]MCW1912931.1 hypothetical protein [Luteolibacter rhizosphaerae]
MNHPSLDSLFAAAEAALDAADEGDLDVFEDRDGYRLIVSVARVQPPSDYEPLKVVPFPVETH